MRGEPGGLSLRSTRMVKDNVPIRESWIPVVRASDVPRANLIGLEIAGQNILCVHSMSGKWYALADRSAYLGIPLQYGKVVDGELIECPQSGTRFSLATGKVVGEWIPKPPFLNQFLRFIVGDPEPIAMYPCRIKAGKVEIYIDVNYRFAYEKKYWKGILDARGKDDGEYY